MRLIAEQFLKVSLVVRHNYHGIHEKVSFLSQIHSTETIIDNKLGVLMLYSSQYPLCLFAENDQCWHYHISRGVIFLLILSLLLQLSKVHQLIDLLCENFLSALESHSISYILIDVIELDE